MVKDWGSEKRAELLGGEKTEKSTNSLVWVTKLPACVKNKFSKFKKYLPEKVELTIAYQKPASLCSLLFDPRGLEKEDGGCEPCGHCKLCGNFGNGQNMVDTTTSFKNKNKKFRINSKLNCKSSGIYVAICTQPGCEESYVGQTSTSFSTRFSGHRNKWVKAPPSQHNRDDTALLDHYREHHLSKYQGWKNDVQMGFDKAFKLIFVDKVGQNLAQQEDLWKMKLQSSINRCNIITPTITY